MVNKASPRMRKLSPRDQEAADRFDERRRREDNARRLQEEVPLLESLKLELGDHRTETVTADCVHVRRVVVANAPALFDMGCTNRECESGGHDITQQVLRALRSGEVTFAGEDGCFGWVRGNKCGRILRYVGTATYRT